MRDTEFFQHLINTLLSGITIKLGDRFEHREQVIPYGQAPEDGGLLRQVSDPFASPMMHSKPTDVFTIKQDGALVAPDEAADHIEAGGFSSAVWTEQANDFAAADTDIDIIDNRRSAKLLDQALGSK